MNNSIKNVVIPAKAGIQSGFPIKTFGNDGFRFRAAIGLAVTFFLISSSLLFAEATKEVTSDAGLYEGPTGLNYTNIKQWAWCDSAINPNCINMGWSDPNNIEVDSLSPLDPAPPEGKTSVWAHVKLNTIYPTHPTWGGWGVFNVDAWGSQTMVWRNFNDYATGALRFWLKSNVQVDVAIEYEDVGGGHNKRTVTVGSTGGVWSEIVLPFSAFPTGINFSKIYGMFLITTSPPHTTAEKTFYVDHVRWTKPLASLQIFPSSVQVNPGKKRQFTIEGRDSSSEYVIVYSRYSAPGTVGTMNPADPTYSISSILTAGTASGNVTGIAKINAVATTSITGPVTNTSADLSSVLGILTENPGIPTLNLGEGAPGQDGSFVIYPPVTDPLRPNDPPVVSDEFNDYVEGTFSVKTVYPTLPSNGYGGWAVQWGNLASNDSVTRDMSNYYDGFIRFWFKGPAYLQNSLKIGIRSGNVPAKKEISKTLLSNYGVLFDNQWHFVQIPIADFAKSRPWADISRTKIFFGLSIEGTLNGSASDRTFYIDNVRWETQPIGALASIQIIPNSATIPLGGSRIFQAIGTDASGNPVDINPTWSFPLADLGELSHTTGATTILNASPTAIGGTLKAAVGLISATINVTVESMIFNYSFNIYSDAGVRGSLGVSTAPASPTNTYLTPNFLETAGGAPEGTKYARSVYTLDDSVPGAQDSFALWFSTEPTGSWYMRSFEDGYLSFYVRTDKDLEFSICSANLDPLISRAKIRLSELNVPLNNTWQRVLVAVNTFAVRDNIDFSNIRTYFAIGGVSKYIGEVTNQVFDVDKVEWLTNSGSTPDKAKVLQGIRDKQRPSGLLRSFDDTHAVTYDQALAAMAFTYNRVTDSNRARNIFLAYKTIDPTAQGYRNEYHVDTFGVWHNDQVCGPNAFLLLALIHYRVATGDNTFDAMIDGLAAWIKNFQDAADGGIKYGISSTIPATTKSTEHNFDCYSAFRAYAIFRNNNTYNTAADQILNWLENKAWNLAQGRFNVGANGLVINTDKALDCYSWAPLALGTDFSRALAPVLPMAEVDFGNTRIFQGNSITGVDFGGLAGAPPDKDAVWLEGMGQMVAAYGFLGNTTSRDRMLNELRKAVFTITANSQGLTYATNGGTAYGGAIMNSTAPSLSSMAWFMFAENNFNPFNVHPLHTIKVKNISNNAVVSQMGWTVTRPQDNWVRANQYLEVINQPVTNDSWGVQIYTDNTNASLVPKFADPTPGDLHNSDSNPAGLLFVTGLSSSSITLPIAWSIKDTYTDLPRAVDPNLATSTHSFQWLYMKDAATPDYSTRNDGNNDVTHFVIGEPWVTIMNENGIHGVQGPVGSDFFPSTGHDYVFIEGDFTSSAAQVTYKTAIVVEHYWQ